MIKKSSHPLLGLGLLAAVMGVTAAHAAVLPTTFLAQQIPFKKNLVAGDQVTATLYSDAACTVPLTDATQTVAIESVRVQDASSKLKVKGVKTAPPKGLELSFGFDLAAAPGGDVYLQVTSGKPGAIVGIPGSCQPQGPGGSIASGAAAGNTPYWDGSQWVTNSSNLYNNGGNVGIGTTAPTRKLSVNGDAVINGAHFIATDTANTNEQLPVGAGALANVIFYPFCQAPAIAATLFIDSDGTVKVMSQAGSGGNNLTVSANSLTLHDDCGGSTTYTLNVTAGVATLVYTSPFQGWRGSAKWIIMPN